MTDKRLQVTGSLPMPANMGEAGRLQIAIGEAMAAFNAVLQMPLECRIVSSRPPKAKVPVSETGTRLTGPALPLPEQQGNGAVEPETPAQPASVAKTTPPWATR